MDKKALMVYNPSSGKKKNHKSMELLLKKLSEIGYQISIHQTIELKGEDNLLKKACDNNWDAIFIVGGDGTVNHTLQYLAEQVYRPKVGVFPFGTSNEFAKFIGMPSDIGKAASVIESGQTKCVDIGKIGSHYFANIAAAGWLTDTTYRTSPYLKWCLGEFAYYLYFLKIFLMTKQPDGISINVSPDKVLSNLSLFLIMNCHSVGPFERLVKRTAEYEEGYFHLLTCNKTNRLKFFLVLLLKLLNITDHRSIIHYSRIKSGSFSVSEPVHINLDGEQTELKSMEFKVLPRHLHVFTSDPD